MFHVIREESPEALVYTYVIPGVEPTNVDVCLAGCKLTVTARMARDEACATPDGTSRSCSHNESVLSRTVTLTGVLLEKVTAELLPGLLVIRCPRTPQ